MKKILTASLVAMMAVTAARAEIASTDYVTTKVNAVNTALSTYKTDNDAAVALKADKTALEAEATTRSEADTELSNRIGAFEGTGAGSVTAQVKAVSDALDAYQTANDAAVALKAAQADLTAEVNRAKAAEQANADAIAALDADYVSEDEMTAFESANTAAIAAAQAAAEATASSALSTAQSALEGQISAETTARTNADAAINTKIGTVPEGKTVVGMIGDAQTAATYDDTEVRDLISDNADAIAAEVSRAEAEEADIRADFAAADALKQGVSSELSLGSTDGAWQTLASISGYSTNCGTGKTCALSNVDGNISWVAVVNE